MTDFNKIFKRKGIAKTYDEDYQFANRFLDDDDFLNKVESSDLVDILVAYRNYIAYVFAEEPLEPIPIYPMGLRIDSGFNHIYARPDGGKTSLAIEFANWFAHRNITTVFADTDNKLNKGQLTHDNILYVPGRVNTHHILRKMVMTKTVGAIVIDTVVAMSNHSNLMKSINKHLRNSGTYCIIMNQTRSYKYGTESAGIDIIKSLSVNNYMIVKSVKIEKRLHIKFDNGHYIIMNDNSKPYLEYNPAATQLAVERSLGNISKIGGKYYMDDKEYTKTKILEIMSNRNTHQNPRGLENA